ncbi:hypothetical protein CEXT_111941 [Caerostris extrusa]|uniref:Uncharacterized protein n=1 Tax=Caerostris extrusa TaxID=172846 RepID=A0AAV4RUW5_CAEEX|nr:hypothetical protein CEXT_111941 [Caerostris extrusa]
MPELTEPLSKKNFFPPFLWVLPSNNSQAFFFFYSLPFSCGSLSEWKTKYCNSQEVEEKLVKTFAWKLDNRTMVGKVLAENVG